MSGKSNGKLLKEKLFYQKNNAFEINNSKNLQEIQNYSLEYMKWLDCSKTEREAVDASIKILEKNGYRPYQMGDNLKKGDKFYLNNRGKNLFAVKVGSEPIENGIRICAAHIDSPRLDLKQHPLFENEGIAYFKTHYYGGIRKYQWATIPLALHGVVTKIDGTNVNIRIGDETGDPVFCITDLLPHLAKEQNSKTLATAFTGEGLNVIFGSSPYIEENGCVTDVDEKVKLNLLVLLNEKYGITEDDFMSAELSIVPAQNAVEVGLDRWLIGAYGHDDRVCAFPALTALLDSDDSDHTCMVVLADKEEIGSEGVTGMKCSILFDLINEISVKLGGNPNITRQNSKCLSADVAACYDPNYPDVSEKKNSAILHCGVGLSKYTGAGGKSSTSDASAEFVGEVRSIFEKAGVLWQTSELGKVDFGGGGTVAKFIANWNIDTVDIGVPVLSMHAPFEIVSKCDLYEAYKAFAVFCK